MPASVVVKPSVTVKGSTVLSVDETEQLVAVVVPAGSEVTWTTSDATKGEYCRSRL